MSNDNKHVWKDYFESRIKGNYSKIHKDILRLVDKELMLKFPNEYPYIHFNWGDINQIYNKHRDEYYGLKKSESKQTSKHGCDLIDSLINAMFTYSIDEHNDAHFGLDNKFPHPIDLEKEEYINIYCMNDINNTIRLSSRLIPNIEIELVHWNKDKDCVYVELEDGRSTVVKRYGDTKDDIYAAVAYAIAKIEFETNSNFKKEVDSHLKIKETKKNG